MNEGPQGSPLDGLGSLMAPLSDPQLEELRKQGLYKLQMQMRAGEGDPRYARLLKALISLQAEQAQGIGAEVPRMPPGGTYGR